MGTDGLGRDVMARLIQGVRIAYKVGIITSLIAIPVGVFLGSCIAAYYGGKVDDIIVWFYSHSSFYARIIIYFSYCCDF